MFECTKCGIETDDRHGNSGSICRDCHNKSVRERLDNMTEAQKERHICLVIANNHEIKLPLEEVMYIRATRNVCDICGTAEGLHVESCHNCWHVRGRVCSSHNQSVRWFEKGSNTDFRIANYLLNQNAFCVCDYEISATMEIL